MIFYFGLGVMCVLKVNRLYKQKTKFSYGNNANYSELKCSSDHIGDADLLSSHQIYHATSLARRSPLEALMVAPPLEHLEVMSQK